MIDRTAVSTARHERGTIAGIPTPAEPAPRPRRPGLPGLGTALTAVAALLLGTPTPTSAQNLVLDEGTFLLSRDGAAVGTESFTVRRTGSQRDPRLILTSEARMRTDAGERLVTSALEATGPDRRITAYQIKQTGDRTMDIYLSLSGRRFQARVVTPEGEQLREYLAEPPVVVVEEDMAHHYFVVADRLGNASSVTVPAVLPRSGAQVRLELRDGGLEAIQIAGRNIQARRIVVQGGGGTRDIWMDERGRILRLVDRSSGLRAERRDPPG